MPQFADQPGAGGGSRASGIAALLSQLGGDRAMGFGQQLLPQIRPNFDMPPAGPEANPAGPPSGIAALQAAQAAMQQRVDDRMAGVGAGGWGGKGAGLFDPSMRGQTITRDNQPAPPPGLRGIGVVPEDYRMFPQVPGQGPAGPPPGLQGIGVTPSPLGLFAQRLATQPTSPAFTTIMAERPPPKPAVDMAPPQLSQPYTTVMPERPQATKVGPQLSQPSPAQLNPYRR